MPLDLPDETPRPRSARLIRSWLPSMRSSGSSRTTSRIAELEAELASAKAALADHRASGQTPHGNGKAAARSPFDDTFSAAAAAPPGVQVDEPDQYYRGSVIACRRATVTGARCPEGAVAEITDHETLQVTAPTSIPLQPQPQPSLNLSPAPALAQSQALALAQAPALASQQPKPQSQPLAPSFSPIILLPPHRRCR